MPASEVLIVAGDPVIETLLGTLVELAGHTPLFPLPDEPPLDAIRRTDPQLILVDCDHSAARTDDFFEEVDSMGAAVLLFGSRSDREETERAAEARHVPSFALPIRYHSFVDVVSAALVA